MAAGSDSPGLPPEAFRARRERYLERAGGAVTVLPAARERYRSRDTELRFRQDSDFHYLTGFPEPEAVAVLTPHDPERRFTLFVRPRDPEREAWSGARTGVEGARERYGADAAYPLEELDAHLRDLLLPADEVVYALGSDPETDRRVTALVAGFRKSRPRSGKGPLVLRDPDTLLPALRVVKEPAELELHRRAARISAEGHREAMRAARPGVGEWELEALLDARFRSAGGGPAYPSIVGSGPNATTLHHVSNDRRARDGDLVLIDAGAEVGMYAGDITRTFPVSGRFSPAQRAVYEVVLEAEEAGIAAVAPGASVLDAHDAAVRVLTRGMVELGLLSGEVGRLIEEGAHRRFYMHQTSHWLGLDVHDVGQYRRPDGEPVRLEPGMVLTVEPGIYVPAGAEDVPAELRGIGVRIEDDVVVTAQGREVTTRGVPVAADEVEALVGAGE